MPSIRRILAVLSTSALTLTLIGCDNGSSSSSNSGADANEPTLTIASNVVGGKNPQEDQQFAAEIGQALHCKVNFIHIPTDYDQKLQAMLSSGQKLDVIYTTGPNLADMVQNGEVMDLQSKIQQSPVLGNPKVVPQWEWNDIRIPQTNGIYAVPVKYQGALMPIVRQDWMNELGLSQPKTLNDFYHIFQVFKEKKGVYGLTLSQLYDIEPFMSAVGLKNEYVMVNGKRTIPYATSEAVPVYEWLHKLYTDKLLDPNFVTNSTADERNEFLSGRVGMFVYWDAWVPMLNNLASTAGAASTFDAEALPGAVGPDGKVLVSKGDTSVWAIPKNAPHPDLAFKFLEWWNTEAGEVLGSLGVKGVDYTVSGGKYQLTEVGKAENMDHGDPQPISSEWKNPFPALQKGYAKAKSIGVQYGYQPTSLPGWTEAQKIVWQYGEEAVLGKLSAQEAVAEMHATLLQKHLVDE
ncbi:extracellular solute-binding protein [Alicyclobacillus pomorum]|jgi:putative aldouronate transport system substrate-binding protein|uniref:extracellular solute-binding protein n=1 Tax=Alicyclobacillus pomorum TaxID=204470 RepID=UPI0004177BF8|nr:extracellular solute-binding protein [Alicyclobacillus pomorum]